MKNKILAALLIWTVLAGFAVLLVWARQPLPPAAARPDRAAQGGAAPANHAPEPERPGGAAGIRPAAPPSISSAAPPPPVATSAGPKPKVDEKPAEQTAAGIYFLPEIAEISRNLNAPRGSVEEDVMIIRGVIEIYRRNNAGAVPEGFDNAQITAKLRGENARRFSVLDPNLESSALNAKGELLDRWGTPYYFHKASRELLEVRSAGPDGKFWSRDDVPAGPFAPGPFDSN
ncbi:MAG TPA: hypothetical protein VIS74_05240 [Chthoniobacterales bacterium]